MRGRLGLDLGLFWRYFKKVEDIFGLVRSLCYVVLEREDLVYE